MPTATCEAIDEARSRSSWLKPPAPVRTTSAPSTSPSASIGTSSDDGSGDAPHSAAASAACTELAPLRRVSASSLTDTADGASPTSGAEACRCSRSPRSSR